MGGGCAKSPAEPSERILWGPAFHGIYKAGAPRQDGPKPSHLRKPPCRFWSAPKSAKLWLERGGVVQSRQRSPQSEAFVGMPSTASTMLACRARTARSDPSSGSHHAFSVGGLPQANPAVASSERIPPTQAFHGIFYAGSLSSNPMDCPASLSLLLLLSHANTH